MYEPPASGECKDLDVHAPLGRDAGSGLDCSSSVPTTIYWFISLSYHIILYYMCILYIYLFIYLSIYLFIFVSFSFHHHFVDISIIFQPSEKSSPGVVCLELWILVVRSSMPPPRTRPQVRLFGRPTWKTAGESQGESIYWSTCRMTAWIPGCHHTLGPMGRHRWHMGQSRAK